jgi:hypothetical protein
MLITYINVLVFTFEYFYEILFYINYLTQIKNNHDYLIEIRDIK